MLIDRPREGYSPAVSQDASGQVRGEKEGRVALIHNSGASQRAGGQEQL
jgi:hypothetical protein